MAKVTFDWSTANEGSQKPFINDWETRHTGFVGGLGSGKSWSGAIKAVLFALSYPGSKGLIGAPTYRQLMDSTMVEFFKVLPKQLIPKNGFSKSELTLKLVNGSEIRFRSMENYEAIRGLEIAWLWLDEANLCSYPAWKVSIGRLRQPGFPHRSWITTTPRGKTGNWLYEEYVLKPEQNPKLAANRSIYKARTRDNIKNIGEEYILDLEATYVGDFAKQELLGEFVDLIEGMVYPQFAEEFHVNFFGEEMFHNLNLPYYGFWDYGIADEGALWIAQKVIVPEHDSLPIKDEDGTVRYRRIPEQEGLALIDLIIADGQNAQHWIDQVQSIEEEYGYPFERHFGDPAGEQRNVTTGKSMASMLREAGIYVKSSKRPFDEGINITHRLLNDRLLFISDEVQMGIASFNWYHWPLDRDGKRREGATKPVHDWASHPMDALRYGVTHLFPVLAPGGFDKRNLKQDKRGVKGPRFKSVKKIARQSDW